MRRDRIDIIPQSKRTKCLQIASRAGVAIRGERVSRAHHDCVRIGRVNTLVCGLVHGDEVRIAVRPAKARLPRHLIVITSAGSGSSQHESGSYRSRPSP